MELFESLTYKNHICAMEKFYNSATFCKEAYTHKKKVMVNVVARKGMIGIPSSVI